MTFSERSAVAADGIESRFLAVRDRFLTIANDNGLMARPAWTLLSSLPMYAACPAAPLPTANRLVTAIINLPSGPSLALRVGA